MLITDAIERGTGQIRDGFNDIEFGAVRGVDLTTIGQKKYEMGSIAATLLVERVEERRSEPVQEFILEPELIIRKTCGFHLTGYQIRGVDKKIDLSLPGSHLPMVNKGLEQ